jgi:hypothetical protein
VAFFDATFEVVLRDEPEKIVRGCWRSSSLGRGNPQRERESQL